MTTPRENWEEWVKHMQEIARSHALVGGPSATASQFMPTGAYQPPIAPGADPAAGLAGPAGPGGTSTLSPVVSVGIEEPNILERGVDWVGDRLGDITNIVRDNLATTVGLVGGGIVGGLPGAVRGANIGRSIDSRPEEEPTATTPDTVYGGPSPTVPLQTDFDLGLNPPVQGPSQIGGPSQYELRGGSTSALNLSNLNRLPVTGGGSTTGGAITDNSGPLRPTDTTPEPTTTPTPGFQPRGGLPGGFIPSGSDPSIIDMQLDGTGTGYIPTVYDAQAITPVGGDGGTRIQDLYSGSLTENVGIDPGDLPQFRAKLNRALAEAKNIGIQRNRPLTQDEIAGVAAGFASNSSERLRIAEQLATANRQITSGEMMQSRELALEGIKVDQVREIADREFQENQRQFDTQMSENQRQFDNNLITQAEFQRREQELEVWLAEEANRINSRSLDLQERFAEEGLALDTEMIDTATRQRRLESAIGGADVGGALTDDNPWGIGAGLIAGWLFG